MTHTLSVLLCVGLCLSQRMRTQAGWYDPPSLSAMPSAVVASGHSVTLQCQSQQWYGMYALYKDGEEISRDLTQARGRGSQANFLIPAVNSTHEGTYRCYSFHSYHPYKWSAPSDPLVLRVTGTFSPSPESGKTQFGESLEDSQQRQEGGRDWMLSPIQGPFVSHHSSCSTLLFSFSQLWAFAQAFPQHKLGPAFTLGGSLRISCPAPQDYTVGNLIRLSLAGLVLLLLGVLLAEAWHSQRGPLSRSSRNP
ncbi:leukocyte immunoglobulin-like receptor subfamily A member 6 [Trichosurus vulpecula]|uniref:leukocyte immunoglobulin-like receptor subfamily A member 6 n=1 Tax=Trichosurus vulpecula TaxID=9337 RepID=UPI00186B2C2E|nr:leukocyte immunoglobulin-like receptor subfamily A member 6 [Trichosurus vulpecula]